MVKSDLNCKIFTVPKSTHILSYNKNRDTEIHMNTTDLSSKGAFWDVTRWHPKTMPI